MSPGKAGKRSKAKRSSDNQTESQETVNSKASPATQSASQARRQISQDLSGSLLESRSQAALSSELTPIRNTTKSKSHTGNVEDPLKHGKLHNFFSYELCLFTDDVKSKSYKKELDRRSEAGTYLKDPANQRCHAVWNLCFTIFHSKCIQTYTQHKNRCTALDEQVNEHTLDNQVVSKEHFFSECLSFPEAKFNMSTESFLCFIRTYEEMRPNDTPTSIMTGLPCPKTFHVKEKQLACKLWERIREVVSTHEFFGLSIDAGIDTIKPQHLVITVLYVGMEFFVLSPVYHQRKKAFNGVEMASHLVTMLRGGLGDTVQKLRYLMVDGCPMNHVARAATETRLKEIYMIATKPWERWTMPI